MNHILLLTLLFGCTDAIERPNFSGHKNAIGTDNGTSDQDKNPSDGAQDGDIPILTGKRLWRLTPEQLANATDALLNRTTQIESKFDTDSPSEDGLGNEADVLSINSVYLTNLEDAISGVVRESQAELEKQLSCSKISAIAADKDCLAKFIDDFGTRAFRRPLTAEEKTRYNQVYTAIEKDLGATEAFLAVAESLLRSPNFLFRSELGDGNASGESRMTAYELASALSFALTNSPPDNELLAKARDGSISDDAVYLAQAKRLIASDAFAKGLTQYIARWSGIRWLDFVDKNKDMFPDYKAETKAAMKDEATAFITNIVKNEKSSFEAFMTSRKTTISPPLASIYGLESFTGTKTIEAKEGERSGFITLPAVMSANSSSNQTGPIHRGVFLLKKLMCTTMPPPPDNASTVVPDTDPTLTFRERFKVHSTDPSCSTCHSRLDPYGFSLEHYDPIGRYRALDNGKPVDASGTIIGTKNSNQNFKSAIDMLGNLAGSEDVHRCFIKNAFRYVYGRAETKADDAQIAAILHDFKESNLEINAIFLSLVTSDAFKTRKDEK